eukprot:365066-Chlamydomonas_euryale.AAC.1
MRAGFLEGGRAAELLYMPGEETHPPSTHPHIHTLTHPSMPLAAVLYALPASSLSLWPASC